jgi:hypothetical protein
MLFRAPPEVLLPRARLGFETQFACPSSRITWRDNFRVLVHTPLLMQFDSAGAKIYEATVERGITGAEPLFWTVNGQRLVIAGNRSSPGGLFFSSRGPIVRARIGG